MVCGGNSCHFSDSDAIICNLRDELEARGLSESVQVILTGCYGFCDKGPVVKVLPGNTFYVGVKPEDAQEIIDEHVVKGRKLKDFFIMTRQLKRLLKTRKNLDS